MKFYAKRVSVGEFEDRCFQVSFDSEPPSEDDLDLSGPDHPYLIVQRQFEDDDDGVCYIETHDHDAYAGHFRLQLIEFTPTCLFFEIARTKDKYVAFQSSTPRSRCNAAIARHAPETRHGHLIWRLEQHRTNRPRVRVD